MIRSKRLLRAVAVFLVLETFFSTISPLVSYALTAGPTAPEATSFEPVDTTDIVNLATGDLVYNSPLFEVPGPAGGYPLSLSYHAGIQPNEEASWVGLGWTLNPGAINRSVNGFPDDVASSPNYSRYYNDGGSTETYSVGVSVGIAGTPFSVNAGLSFSQDTYQGFGVGGSLGVGAQIGGENSPLGIHASVGVSPYGRAYASAGMGLSVPIAKGGSFAMTANLGISARVSGNSVNFSGSVGLDASKVRNREGLVHTKSVGLVGADISTDTKSTSGSVSVVGSSHSSNTSSNKVSSYSSGATIPIPLWWGVALTVGYNYQRYWIDQLDNFVVNGAMYYPNNTTELTTHSLDKVAYDSYSLLDKDLPGGIISNPDPDKVMGGTFPGYDSYVVHAQGIAGVMRPYYYQRHLYKRNNYSKEQDGSRKYNTIQYDISKANSGERNFNAEFRFINDFSNRFEYTPGAIVKSNSTTTPLTYSFGPGTDVQVGETGTTYTNNKVQGSKAIEWLTNKDIETNSLKAVTTGIRETYSTGFTRANSDLKDDSNIGAFVVTNESGVKYHFALPAYAYSEYFYSGKKTGTETFNESYREGKYAYNWYLTGITGPDYVDRGPSGPGDGKLNSYDWGYWVEFEYGKWSDLYAWRNPSEGMSSDLDDKFQNFSEGVKEVYYLDAIRTKTHSALFIKDIRDDAKSAVFYRRDNDHGKIKLNPNSKTGGFIPNGATCNCAITDRVPVYDSHGVIVDHTMYYENGTLTYNTLPASSMKLTSIILVENSNAVYSKAAGSAYEQKTTNNWNITTNTTPGYDICDFSSVTTNYHLYQNVLDVYDLANAPGLILNAIKKIDLVTDYSLSPETANSFDYNKVKVPNPSYISQNYPTSGKLTLKQIQIKGKAGNGGTLMPPLKFSYDVAEKWYTVTLFASSGSPSFSLANSGYRIGDIVRFTYNSLNYYAVINSISGSTHYIKFIGKNSISGQSPGVLLTRTKNPPYKKNFYDSWGLYKSDYNENTTLPDRFARQVTGVSANSLDVWSLRKVTTQTGSSIVFDYEADSYARTGSSESNSFIVSGATRTNGITTIKLDNSASLDFSTIFSAGNTVNFLMCMGDYYDDEDGYSGFSNNIQRGSILIESLANSNGVWSITTLTNLDNLFLSKDVRDPINADPYNTYYGSAFIAGNISTPQAINRPGGGIRVKSIAVESNGKRLTTNYSYVNPTTPALSSGVTSYEPIGMNEYNFFFPASQLGGFFYSELTKSQTQDAYKRELYKEFSLLLTNSRELPSPGVLYEYVSVSDQVNGIPVVPRYESIYQFEVMTDGLVDLAYSNTNSYPEGGSYEGYIPFSKKESRQVTLKDYSARVGALKSVKLVDHERGLTVSETTNEYLHDAADWTNTLANQFNNQGVIEETFTDARFARVASQPSDYFSLQGVITKREQYPLVQVGQTTTNYITNVTSKTRNVGFDYYSGTVTTSSAVDPYGNTFLTEVIPAYRRYTNMGLAANGGKNMLTQVAGQTTYLVNGENINEKIAVVNASAQTWSDQLLSLTSDLSSSSQVQSGIWRKEGTYSFIGDPSRILTPQGFYPIADFAIFYYTGASNPLWKKEGAVTLVDINSHALEAADMNGIYAASRTDNKLERIVASASNARYAEFNYTGFEGLGLGGTPGGIDRFNFYPGSSYGAVSNEAAHTGNNSLKKTTSGPGGFLFSIGSTSTLKAGKYRISAWVKASNSSHPKLAITPCGGGSTVYINADPAKQNSGWYLLEYTFDYTPGCAVSISGYNSATSIMYWDDIRFHPLEGNMSAYVYNNWGELWYILNNNNMYTRFEYDDIGRLIKTYQETFTNAEVKLNETKYNYANQ